MKKKLSSDLTRLYLNVTGIGVKVILMLYLFSVKISILLNGKPMEELSCICHASKAHQKVYHILNIIKLSLHMQGYDNQL